MQTYFIRFAPAAGVLVAAMLCGAPSFAQTGGASNVIPNAGSKQDPDVTKPAAVNTTKAERQAARQTQSRGHRSGRCQQRYSQRGR
ncbi:hypothetical protein LP414_15935 [Polaromonas sp. P1(28)-13]|nr:hypothetical protein LP414_15935 [Polaromonas sp. P1(28)-13]